MNEATGLKLSKRLSSYNKKKQKLVQEETLEDMITHLIPKYNGLDHKEIEKSKGNIEKFKYTADLVRTIRLLRDVKTSMSSSSFRDELTDILDASEALINHFHNYKREYIYYIGKNDLFLTLFYTSSLYALTHGLSYLICECITFDEVGDEVELVVEESKVLTKNVYIRSIKEYAKATDSGTFSKIFSEAKRENIKNSEAKATKEMNESFALSAGAIDVMGGLATGVGTIPILVLFILFAPLVLWKLIPLIREVLYSVYYFRVRVEESMEIQINLIETNIESLQHRKMNKKIIVRQKKVVKFLDKIRTVFAVKIDNAETKALKEIRIENKDMGIKMDHFDKQPSSLMI